jgi:hypothetical protein
MSCDAAQRRQFWSWCASLLSCSKAFEDPTSWGRGLGGGCRIGWCHMHVFVHMKSQGLYWFGGRIDQRWVGKFDDRLDANIVEDVRNIRLIRLRIQMDELFAFAVLAPIKSDQAHVVSYGRPIQSTWTFDSNQNVEEADIFLVFAEPTEKLYQIAHGCKQESAFPLYV